MLVYINYSRSAIVTTALLTGLADLAAITPCLPNKMSACRRFFIYLLVSNAQPRHAGDYQCQCALCWSSGTCLHLRVRQLCVIMFRLSPHVLMSYFNNISLIYSPLFSRARLANGVDWLFVLQQTHFGLYPCKDLFVSFVFFVLFWGSPLTPHISYARLAPQPVCSCFQNCPTIIVDQRRLCLVTSFRFLELFQSYTQGREDVFCDSVPPQLQPSVSVFLHNSRCIKQKRRITEACLGPDFVLYIREKMISHI